MIIKEIPNSFFSYHNLIRVTFFPRLKEKLTCEREILASPTENFHKKLVKNTFPKNIISHEYYFLKIETKHKKLRFSI